MLRFLFFALLAANLSIALPTVSHITTITKRGDNVNLVERGIKHHKPRKHHHKHHHKHHTTTTAPNPCGSGTPYYLQAAENDQYAIVNDDFVAVDSLEVDFTEATTVTATMFAFAEDSDGTCRLSIFPTEALPDAAGFLSFVVDSNDDSDFDDPHIVRIIGPVLPDPTEYITTVLECSKSADSQLSCSAADPAGVSPTQNVLQIRSSGQLIISATASEGTSPIFNLIPVL